MWWEVELVEAAENMTLFMLSTITDQTPTVNRYREVWICGGDMDINAYRAGYKKGRLRLKVRGHCVILKCLGMADVEAQEQQLNSIPLRRW